MKSNNRLLYILIAILTIWCIVLTTMATNNSNTQKQEVNEIIVNGISTDFTKIINDRKDSLVTINSYGNIGTGFVYKQDGDSIYIVTAYHTLADSISYYVCFANGYNVNAELVGKNLYSDVAVLKVYSPYSIETLNFADSTLSNSGEFIVCIGTPVSIDYDASVELGMISNADRVIENSITINEEEIKYYIDVMQLSSNLKPGFSGSPVINMNGEVVGMVTMNIQEGFNFAITSNELKIIVDKIIANEQTTKYQLGIKGSYVASMPMFERSNLNLSVETINGLYVEKLADNSIALLAGVKTGDVILNINDQVLTNLDDYLKIVYNQTDSFIFEILRDGEVFKLTVNIND